MRPENFSPTLGATDPGTGIPGLQRVENYYSTQSFAISQLRCWLLSSPGSYGGIIELVYAISAVFMLITISHVRNKFSPCPSGFQLQRRLGRMTKKLSSRSKWSQPINFHFPGKTPPSLSSFQDSSGKRPSWCACRVITAPPCLSGVGKATLERAIFLPRMPPDCCNSILNARCWCCHHSVRKCN